MRYKLSSGKISHQFFKIISERYFELNNIDQNLVYIGGTRICKKTMYEKAFKFKKCGGLIKNGKLIRFGVKWWVKEKN